ncbi:ABC transporter ATP-binding protein [Paenibacillus sp. FSL H7-0331]|uniref:ABC transporter ATP-binding protein n=1 Tax=Paenibacillus sp. FSL H7-0331 TaxID=1920421 RepID=UPI00096D9114|nr:ABC transporter ATP-binding protein [Paenibacillus sp. FSL H7-0331]OMF20896.1 transporter [Paenibacillus sp. FSL H7-0331]
MNTEIIRVTKHFGSQEVLKGIDLQIQSGEFVAILGPSGCGKTTLLRLMAGFDHTTAGEIRIAGRTVDGNGHNVPPEHRNIGMVFQSFALWPHLSVKEHVRFPLRHQSNKAALPRANELSRISEVLEMVGLTQLADRMPHELSGGQKQRVAFARAVAAKPSLLLMDEPLSSLDAMLRLEMRREIQSLHRRSQASIVYVTHDQGEALAMADRIVVMNEGRIEQIGTPQDVYLRPQSSFVARFVSKANLVEGSWDGAVFHPRSENLAAPAWVGNEVSGEIKASGLYPVRPDQFLMHRDGRERSDRHGLPGQIVNVQYQGKEIHYAVNVNGHTWDVHTGFTEPFEVGERVQVALKQQAV